jgi:tetratricopeptide (TPR) repeat protein
MVRKLGSTLLVLTLCLSCACGVPYDRYMQEGHKLRGERDFAGAKASFHKAVLVSSSDARQKERLIDALLAEKECTFELHQSDDTLKILSEVTSILEKAAEYKRAAIYQMERGNVSAAVSADDALECYQAAMDDLKKAEFETSPEAAAILAAIADLKTGQKDYKSAATLLEKACALLDKIKYGDNDHDHAVYLQKLASVYEQLDRENDAIAATQRAKALEMTGVKFSVGKLKSVSDLSHGR